MPEYTPQQIDEYRLRRETEELLAREAAAPEVKRVKLHMAPAAAWDKPVNPLRSLGKQRRDLNRKKY